MKIKSEPIPVLSKVGVKTFRYIHALQERNEQKLHEGMKIKSEPNPVLSKVVCQNL